MGLKTIARKIAKDCGYLQELQMLENLYYSGNYSNFLFSLRQNSQFTLYDVDILPNFAGFFDENSDFFMQWLENEAFEIGRESVLSFLEIDLKVSFDDFLRHEGKGVKESVVQGFVYSCSVALYDYFNENEILAEHLELYSARELVSDF